MTINISVAALALLAVSAANPPLQPTEKDVRAAVTAQSYAPYPEGDILTWRQDLQALLRRGRLNTAGDTLAARYGFAAADMQRLVRAWVIAQSRRYDSDHAWVPAVRAELHALAPLVRGRPLGLAIIAGGLEATTEDCSADDFNALIKGSADPAADGYVIASAASCTGNFARAATAGGARGVPALIRAAEYGGLPPRDTLPLYAWLTLPTTLAHIRQGDRFAVSAMLWQRYLTALFEAGLHARALAAFDTLPVDLRAAIVSPGARPQRVAIVDGIAMTFGAEDKSDEMTVMVDTFDDQLGSIADMAAGSLNMPPKPAKQGPRNLSAIDAPILQLAEAMATAGREAEARQLLSTLPGLAEAKASVACEFAWTQTAKSPCKDARRLPMGALPLDHLLNNPGSDPYPIAETTLSGSGGFGRGAGDVVVCRVFSKADYGDLCPQGIRATYFIQTSVKAEELAVGEAALEQLIPNFSAVRTSLLGTQDVPGSAVAKPEWASRSTVAAVPPTYVETSIPAEYSGAATSTTVKGLAPLPSGFELVRAERAGQRVVAISVSQTYDPTGEVSRGGYWVHISDDAGKHWDRPLYTGLADRFPYVVTPASRLPLIAGDTLQLAVDVSEVDTASITYPPVALRSRRRAKNRFLAIPLAALQQDSDGDGLTDVAAHHLLLDRPRTKGSMPFVIGSDYDADCRVPPSPEKLALIQLLGRMTGVSGAAVVEPVDRPAGEMMTGLRGAAAAVDQPVFLIGDRQTYACLSSRRMIIVYDQADIEAIKQFTPDFHALEMPRIVFNRAHDRGYVRWSTGWAGGTYRLRRVKENWQFDSISSWIS